MRCLEIRFYGQKPAIKFLYDHQHRRNSKMGLELWYHFSLLVYTRMCLISRKLDINLSKLMCS